MEQATGILETVPDKRANTCTFVMDKAVFPDDEYFAPETYKQIRQGLVRARLNYTLHSLHVTVLDEDQDTLTFKIEGAED